MAITFFVFNDELTCHVRHVNEKDVHVPMSLLKLLWQVVLECKHNRHSNPFHKQGNIQNITSFLIYTRYI